MESLLVIGLGGLLGLGVWLVIAAWRGVELLPEPHRLVPSAVAPEKAAVWLGVACAAGLVVGLTTRWPVAGIAVFAGVLFGPAVLGGRSRRTREVAVAEGIATWTEMIRDTMAGASGLEESLVHTAAVSPVAIRPEVTRFASKLRHQSLEDALAGLADDLDHPSADLLVAALGSAARLEARDLGGLLGRLAEAIRGDVRMRVRVEVGRTRLRTSAKIAVFTTVGTVALLYLFAGHLLEAYDSSAGQIWLAVVAGVFFAAGWLLNRMGKVETADRFTLRIAEDH